MMGTAQLALEMVSCVHIPLRKLIGSYFDKQTNFYEKHGWQWHNGTLLWTDPAPKASTAKNCVPALSLSCADQPGSVETISKWGRKYSNQNRSKLSEFNKWAAHEQGRGNCRRTECCAACLLSGTVSVGDVYTPNPSHPTRYCHRGWECLPKGCSTCSSEGRWP